MRSALFALLFLTSCTHGVQGLRTPAGTAISGGGNGQVAEFFLLAKLFHYAAVKSGLQYDVKFESARFDSLMKDLRLEATEDLLTHEGVRVEAINYPPQCKVRFNSSAWAMKTKLDKYRLVVHELLNLLDIPDPKYATSEAITARSRFILGTVGVDLEKAERDQLLYTDNSGDPVICSVIPQPGVKVALEFLLRPGAGVATEVAQIREDLQVTVHIAYGNEGYAQMELRRARERERGKLLASSTAQYYGPFRNFEVITEEHRVYCRLKSEFFRYW